MGSLYKEVYEIRAKWKQLGVELNLTPGTIDSIELKRQTPADRLYEILHEWLKSGNATREDLLHSLEQETVGGAHLIEKMVCLSSFKGELCRSMESIIIYSVATKLCKISFEVRICGYDVPRCGVGIRNCQFVDLLGTIRDTIILMAVHYLLHSVPVAAVCVHCGIVMCKDVLISVVCAVFYLFVLVNCTITPIIISIQ